MQSILKFNGARKGQRMVKSGIVNRKNKALLINLLQRLSDQFLGGWQDVISKKCKPTFDNGLPFFNLLLSDTWQGIYFITNIVGLILVFIKESIRFKLGNKKDVCFWSNHQLEYGILMYLFPQLQDLFSKLASEIKETGFQNNESWS